MGLPENSCSGVSTDKFFDYFTTDPALSRILRLVLFNHLLIVGPQLFLSFNIVL